MNDPGLGLAADDLGCLSALLDEIIDFGEAEREVWFARLKGDDVRLLPALRRILSRQASRETADLLERGPTFTAPHAF